MTHHATPPQIYELLFGEFAVIVNGFCRIYDSYRRDTRIQQYFNSEDQLRDFLIGNKYLKSWPVLKSLGLTGYIFEPEGNTYDDNDFSLGGRCDIKVLLKDDQFREWDCFFLFECKRLGAYQDLADEYVNKGIQRFISGKYPTRGVPAGMIGFLVAQTTVPTVIAKINHAIMKTMGKGIENYLKPFPIEVAFEGVYSSDHTCQDESELKLMHIIYALA